MPILITPGETRIERLFAAIDGLVLAGGGDIDVFGWPSPNFGDFDDDGDLDLLCGEFLHLQLLHF